ncbi:MAG: Na/Pi symporter [Phycisphaerales bacterium]|nr:Na/Pi symporter [Phycisphaerales bacterium]
MQTLINILGGVGLFLLGMSIMTNGLKAVAGPGLRTMLGKAAATPLSGAFWGAFVTLIIQSSSATTMTTIGLVSAGLLTFAQGLGLVFGANVGTTGTGWLIALIGVRVSLTAYALLIIFVGAMIKLLGNNKRVSAGGAALAGFALLLLGLTTLQEGMGGFAQQFNPADFPGGSSMLGVLALVGIGLVMTAVMQSSTAAIAVTLTAYFAKAIELDQACALIIGQNIGTATSSALAAIGASSTAKRLALAYILFKLIAAGIALALFPLTMPLIERASASIAGETLLAGYHTAYNVIGVAVLLPLAHQFTRMVERILPERASPLTRCLDRAALETPLATEEAVRRTVARSLESMCRSVGAVLATATPGTSVRSWRDAVSVTEARDALRQARDFMSEASGPPESQKDESRLTSTLHAMDHATRLAEVASEKGEFRPPLSGSADAQAAELCEQAMRNAVLIAEEIGALPGTRQDCPVESALVELERCAAALGELQRTHRRATLSSAVGRTVSADEAIARVDTVRRFESLARHAWRSAAHLVGKVAS